MTQALYAAAVGIVCVFLGCLYGDWRGRRDERKAWLALVRRLYASGKGGGAEGFRIAMVTKANRVEASGWK